MQESAGRRLSKARRERGLSIEEVAHATRIRPDKITALENGDYSRFGSNAYAKGFLLIYGRYLGQDVAEEARSLESFSDLQIRDYQYLENIEIPAATEKRPRPMSRQRTVARQNRPSALPLIFVVVAIIALGFGYYLHIMAQRLEDTKPAPQPAPPVVDKAKTDPSTQSQPESVAQQATRSTSAPANPAEPATNTQAPIAAAPVNPGTEPAVNAANAASNSTNATNPGAPAVPAVPEVRRAEPVNPPPGTTELAIVAKRKTWIRVHKDDPDSKAVFNEYIYPDAPALKLRGSRFYVNAADPTAIELRKNGAPVSYQAGTPIQ